MKSGGPRATYIRHNFAEEGSVGSKPPEQQSSYPPTMGGANTGRSTREEVSEHKDPGNSSSKPAVHRKNGRDVADSRERARSSHAKRWASEIANLMVERHNADPQPKTVVPSLPTGLGLGEVASTADDTSHLSGDAQTETVEDTRQSMLRTGQIPSNEIANAIILHMLSSSRGAGGTLHQANVPALPEGKSKGLRSAVPGDIQGGDRSAQSNAERKRKPNEALLGLNSNPQPGQTVGSRPNGGVNELPAVIATTERDRSINGSDAQTLGRAIEQVKSLRTSAGSRHSQNLTSLVSKEAPKEQSERNEVEGRVTGGVAARPLLNVSDRIPGIERVLPRELNVAPDGKGTARVQGAHPSDDHAPLAFELKLQQVKVADTAQPEVHPDPTAITGQGRSTGNPVSNTSLGEGGLEPGGSPDTEFGKSGTAPAQRSPEALREGTSDSAHNGDERGSQETASKALEIDKTDASKAIQPAGADLNQTALRAVDSHIVEHTPLTGDATTPKPHVEPRDAAQQPQSARTPARSEPTTKPETASAMRPVASQLSVRISGPDASPVDLRIAERKGEIQVAVRAMNSDVRGSLRGDLTSLVDSLRTGGFDTSVSKGSSADVGVISNPMHHIGPTTLAHTDRQDASGDAPNRQGQNPSDQQNSPRQQQGRDQRRSQGERGFLAWIEQLTAS